MSSIDRVGIEEVDGLPVAYVIFKERMEVLSSAVLNGGSSTATAAFIMQVCKNYDVPDPEADAARVRDALGLPDDSVGMMTAAEVDYVFNSKEASSGGTVVECFSTAGLSNHVIAGEYLDDYDEKSMVSSMRASRLRAGTINVCVVSPVPLTSEGKVNLFIPLVEGKSVALAERGFRETGTTSDSMAVFSPIGDGRVSWTGTGSDVGMAAARAVTASVGHALAARDEHPAPMTPYKILGRLGLGPGDLHAMSGSSRPSEEFSERLDDMFARADVSAAMDLIWFSADRADSMAEDGNEGLIEFLSSSFSRLLGTEPPSEGSMLDRMITMISMKAGGI